VRRWRVTLDTEDRIDRAAFVCEQAIFSGDPTGLEIADRELDRVEADLALTRGRVLHGRYLQDGSEDPHELMHFERAAELYRALGAAGGEGEALLWIGIFHQVVRHDDETAVPLLERAGELAAGAGDGLTQSYVLRHLGIAEHSAGRWENARQRLEESTLLRRQLGFRPGVAANLVGLAYIAAAQGRHSEAIAIAEDAIRIAEACGAAAIVQQAHHARADVSTADQR
jgi:tetratricopeptide (TPR) repeat protein